MIPIGTTPTNTFNVPIDLREAEALYITYQQFGRTIVEKAIEDVEIEEDKLITNLTQLETLRFNGKGEIKIQIRARLPNGKAIKSKVIHTSPDELLKDGVI